MLQGRRKDFWLVKSGCLLPDPPRIQEHAGKIRRVDRNSGHPSGAVRGEVSLGSAGATRHSTRWRIDGADQELLRDGRGENSQGKTIFPGFEQEIQPAED